MHIRCSEGLPIFMQWASATGILNHRIFLLTPPVIFLRYVTLDLQRDWLRESQMFHIFAPGTTVLQNWFLVAPTIIQQLMYGQLDVWLPSWCSVNLSSQVRVEWTSLLRLSKCWELQLRSRLWQWILIILSLNFHKSRLTHGQKYSDQEHPKTPLT